MSAQSTWRLWWMQCVWLLQSKRSWTLSVNKTKKNNTSSYAFLQQWLWPLLFFIRCCLIILFLFLSDATILKLISESATFTTLTDNNDGMQSIEDDNEEDDGAQTLVIFQIFLSNFYSFLQASCPSCSAALNFKSTGKNTTVCCYQCQSIVEFSVWNKKLEGLSKNN